MKKFKSKKKSKFHLKYIILPILIYFISKITFNFFYNSGIKFNNTEYLKLLLSESNKSIKYEINKIDLPKKLIGLFSNIDINNPKSIIEKNFSKVIINKTDIETDKYFLVSKEQTYIEDPNPIKITEPIIYLYNTHQLENYKKNELYGVSANVMTTSFMIKDAFNKLDLPTIVEERRINEIMNINNWSNFYKASKYLLEDTINNNKTLKYFIDVHRDSVSEKYTTITVDGQRYAKVYFVIGKENENYNKNMTLAGLIDIKMNSKIKGISKGILLKEGKGVNGIYNQDINENVLLVEFGGVDNTIEEVSKTVEIFTQSFKEVINEK